MYPFISIFKTNISVEQDKDNIIDRLRTLAPNIDVHIDLEDDEKIMRVASKENLVDKVMSLLRVQQFDCEAMAVFYEGNLFR